MDWMVHGVTQSRTRLSELHFHLMHIRASLAAQMVKNPPAMQSWVRSPGREDPLQEGMATLSSILAWRIPWTEEPDRLQSVGVAKSACRWICYEWTEEGEHMVGPPSDSSVYCLSI